MSLLTIEHSGINARLKPTGPCDGPLISIPLAGRRICACQTHMAFLPKLYAPNRRCYFLLRSWPPQSALPLFRVTGYSTIHFSFFVKCFNLKFKKLLCFLQVLNNIILPSGSCYVFNSRTEIEIQSPITNYILRLIFAITVM